MPGPLVKLVVYDDEVMLKLEGLPRRVRDALHLKFERIFDQVRGDFFKATPAKFLDPSLAIMDVTDVGSSVLGYIEINQKDGTYTITAKSQALRFISKGGELLFRKSVQHAYPKVGPTVAR